MQRAGWLNVCRHFLCGADDDIVNHDANAPDIVYGYRCYCCLSSTLITLVVDEVTFTLSSMRWPTTQTMP